MLACLVELVPEKCLYVLTIIDDAIMIEHYYLILINVYK
jgi:hypothetical protein